jgi:hypothetical protein
MAYPTEAMIAHRVRWWEQPAFFKTLKEIRSYPERRNADRCKTVPGREP